MCTCEENEICVQNLCRKISKEETTWEELSVNRRIILKCIRENNVKIRTHLTT
jgi:hypothetical protein